MRHRAVGAGFRSGRYSGTSPRELRADALSRRAELFAGSRFTARDPRSSSMPSLLTGVLAVGTGIAIGYAIGKWLKRPSTVGVDESNRYLVGSLVLAQ